VALWPGQGWRVAPARGGALTRPGVAFSPACGRQHEIVRVATARMRYDKDRGRLVNKDEVKIWVFNRFRKERNAHLGWIMRSSSLMAVDLDVDPTLMHSVLDRYLREHLADVSKAQLFDLPE